MKIFRVWSFILASILCMIISGNAWSAPALLGVAPGVPNTTYLNTGTAATSYDPVTGFIKVTATPLGTMFVAGGSRTTVATPRSLTISIQVDTSGNLIGGVAGDDLVLTGTVGGYTGTLLTGEIIEYGIQDASTTIDYLDFRFRVTGGSMAGLFAGQDIGVTQAIENSTFAGSFTTTFKGTAKGNLGPILPKQVCNGSIGDFIWNDANRNGIQDGGELGIDNVTVNLKNSSGAVIDTKVSGPNGAYLFTGLCAGDYTVVVDTGTLPPGFVASPTLQGGNPAIDSNPNSSAVNLPTGTSNDLTIDFGYNSPCSGSIGDLVWHDLNRNGIQDPGEPGLGTITVNLRDPLTDNLITSTTTNGTGFYTFSGLCAGNYRVEAIAPSGFVLSPALQGGNTANDSNLNPTDVFLATDNTGDVTIDFGFNTPCAGSIGDFVWNDLNRNGIQDSGEPGINGVRVWLKDDFNNLIATATTTGNGGYQFGGLCAGTYRVEVDTTSTALAGMVVSPSGVGSDRTVDSNGSPATVVLATDNSSDPTIDFGYNSPCSGFIGDMVWLDANRDGIQNNGELGINGVAVTLKDAANVTVATTTTGLGPLGQAGFYKFSGLCGGNYTVEVATPTGLQPSPSTQGLDTTVDSNGSPASVNLPSDYSSDATIDFGFNAPCAGSIGNLVWDDLNRNGIQDSGEPGLDGVAVRLLTVNNVQLASTTTANAGLYSFIGLCAGDYKVEVVPPAGRTASPTLVGADRTVDSNPNPNAVNLPTDSSSDQSIDFGFNTPCSGKIGDFVWHDTNRDGIQNFGEPGISGAAVILKNNLGVVISTTNTNPAGGYLFGGLCRGDYVVEVVTPAGFVASPSKQGLNSALDSNGIPAPVSLLADDGIDLTIDFGFNTPCTGSIGDLVWNDLNQNGIQDSGEPGITDVTVNLRDINNTLLRTTSTAPDGSYHFIGLCSGDYKVEVVSPAGMTPTTTGAGSDPEKDSNPNPSIVFLSSDATIDNSIDFGFFTLAPAITVAETCANAPSPDMPIVFTATISNTGNETLTGISCTDTLGKTVAVADIIPGASGSATFSYIQLTSPLSDTVTCSAKGTISNTTVSATSASVSCIVINPALTIKKYTNGDDADAAPGPSIAVGGAVTWTYTVANTGNVVLTNVVVTDDKIGAICTIPTLAAGASQTCTKTGVAVAGQYENMGTVTGTNGNTTVTAKDPSHYFGTAPALTIKKYTNGDDADAAPGPSIAVGGAVTWTYTVKNTGNVLLTNVVVTDDKIGAICTIPTLAVGASQTCTKTGVATAGQYENKGTASVTYNTTTVTVSDLSHYYGVVQCLQCKDGVSYMTLKLDWRVTTGDPNERIRVHADSMTGPLLYDSWTDSIPGDGLAVGTDFGFAVPLSAKQVLVTVQGLNHINETLKATFSAECDLPIGQINGNTYIQFKVVSAQFDGDRSCGTASIGDYVWNDLNKDGIQNSNEFGLSGVAVNLLPCSGTVPVATTTTDLAGKYLFTSITPGSYKVQFVLPSGYVFSPKDQGVVDTVDSDADITTGTTACVNLVVGANDLTWDAGMYLKNTGCTYTQGFWKNHIENWPATSLKLGTVMYTRDQLLTILQTPVQGNGLISLSHQLIATKLNIINEAMVPAAVQTAINSAEALIGGLVVPPIGTGFIAPASSSSLEATLDTYNSGLAVGGPTHCQDLPAVPCTGSIGNLVWNDLNIDGIQNAGEPGLSGLTVTLKNALTGTTKTDVTDSNGYYMFTNLCAATYTVTVATPTGMAPSAALQGTDRELDSNGSPSTVVLPTDSYNNNSIDFGFYQPCSGSIGDLIWNDANNNGIQDAGELGIAGVTVTLKGTSSSCSTTTTTLTTTTNANGKYIFSGLCAGNYTVTVQTPAGYSASPSLKGTDRAKDSNGSPSSVALVTNNSSDLTIDFGFYKCSSVCTGSIGDVVWSDLNNNGIQDAGEPKLAGVLVTLKNNATGLIVATKVTDTNGAYKFTSLCSGSYTVTVTAPDGYSASPSLKGTNRGTDSNGSPATVALSTNSSSDLTVDFGYYKAPPPPATCTGQIGDFIWNDINSNGIQDSGESGISGVTVSLKNTGTGAVTTATTDASGKYLFSGLCAATYTVTVTTPTSFKPSPSSQGTDRSKDSSVNPVTVIIATNSSSDLNTDFGFYKCPTPAQATGCSLGYWKTHTANWPTAYKTTSDFDITFGTSAYKPDINLLQALNSGGGGLSKLARQGAAALLNAQDTRVTGFPLSAAEVKTAVKNAIASGNYEPLATQLDTYNNLGCPLN